MYMNTRKARRSFIQRFEEATSGKSQNFLRVPPRGVSRDPARRGTYTGLAMPIELRRFTVCSEFLAAAGAFLAAREAEHNLMLGLCHVIVTHPEVYPDPWFLVAVDADDGRVVG